MALGQKVEPMGVNDGHVNALEFMVDRQDVINEQERRLIEKVFCTDETVVERHDGVSQFDQGNLSAVKV